MTLYTKQKFDIHHCFRYCNEHRRCSISQPNPRFTIVGNAIMSQAPNGFKTGNDDSLGKPVLHNAPGAARLMLTARGCCLARQPEQQLWLSRSSRRGPWGDHRGITTSNLMK